MIKSKPIINSQKLFSYITMYRLRLISILLNGERQDLPSQPKDFTLMTSYVLHQTEFPKNCLSLFVLLFPTDAETGKSVS